MDEAGEDAVRRAERAVMLFQIDRAWRDHLAFAADLREGIHLVSLGGQDPLTRFTTDIKLAFRRMEDAIDSAVLDALTHVRVSGGRIDLEGLGIRGPSSTWTYLVNDDPFRNQIGMMLTGPGRTTHRHLCRGRDDAAAAPVGAGRSRPAKAAETPRGSVPNVKTTASFMIRRDHDAAAVVERVDFHRSSR